MLRRFLRFLSPYKDRTDYVQQAAGAALSRIGTAESLPLMVLACRKLSPKQRMEALEALCEVRYGDKILYNIANVRDYCFKALDSKDEDVRMGAQAVLNWMNGDQFLLQSSHRDSAKDGVELLRPATGGVDSEPETLLLASAEPEIVLKSPVSRRPFWKRFCKK